MQSSLSRLSQFLARVQQFCWAEGESVEAVRGHMMLPLQFTHKPDSKIDDKVRGTLRVVPEDTQLQTIRLKVRIKHINESKSHLFVNQQYRCGFMGGFLFVFFHVLCAVYCKGQQCLHLLADLDSNGLFFCL